MRSRRAVRTALVGVVRNLDAGSITVIFSDRTARFTFLLQLRQGSAFRDRPHRSECGCALRSSRRNQCTASARSQAPPSCSKSAPSNASPASATMPRTCRMVGGVRLFNGKLGDRRCESTETGTCDGPSSKRPTPALCDLPADEILASCERRMQIETNFRNARSLPLSAGTNVVRSCSVPRLQEFSKSVVSGCARFEINLSGEGGDTVCGKAGICGVDALWMANGGLFSVGMAQLFCAVRPSRQTNRNRFSYIPARDK